MTQPLCTIDVLDEVFARVRVSEDVDHRMLAKKYAIPTKNHFFDPRFTMGTWDGKIHFFKENGHTYTHFLPDIIETLSRNGYDFELNDHRPQTPRIVFPVVGPHDYSHIIYPDTGEPVVIAEHQLRVINGLLGHTNGIAEAATGAGKTIITAVMCDLFQKAGLRTIVVVPNLDLIDNTRDELAMMGITDVGALSGVEKDIDHSIVISTWQTLKNVPVLMKQFTCVLVDETHGARSAELNKLLVEFGSKIVYRYGMTGTMPPDPCEATNVHVALGPIRAVVAADELIRIGWLARPDIEMLILEEDLQAEYAEFKRTSIVSNPITYHKFKQSYFPDFTSENAYLNKNKRRLQWIADHLDSIRNERGNTFVLVTSIDKGKKLAELCPNAVFVHGSDKVKMRKRIYELFRERDDMMVIATVGIAAVGLNIKRIFNLVLIDIGRSFIRTIQAIGRGLRRSKDKDAVFVVDIGSDLKYGTKHAKDRRKYYDDKKYPNRTVKVDYTKG